MLDREKVINDLQDAVNDDWMWQHADSYARTMEKAIQLLKEQKAVEPVKWIYPTDVIGFGRCPHCNSLWDYSLISNMFFKHCPRCGREVKWE